jgi:DNA-binding FadR family transcriptional regulator
MLPQGNWAQYFYIRSVRHKKQSQPLFNAIKRQDPDAARATMVLHLTNSRDRFSG